ncbi:MAG: hypothetical protein R3F08_10215 [Dokdonella sp.]|nr:hypothetical protein [Xanthomonadales bacterium]MCB1573792.1 hypothetical protein [Xanthomonadales bacterium]MCB1576920.1 hypothetical protein [Xanthomonadales bacterium]
MKSRSLAAVLCCFAGSLLANAVSAEQIYSNGPYVTHPGGHVSGADLSLAQDVTYPGYTALGFAAGPAYRLTDDFSIPLDHIWTIDSAVIYAYQTGSADAAFTDARVIIWQGFPDAFGSVKLFDGSVANVLASSTPDAYRAAQSMPDYVSNTDRRIKRLQIAIPPLQLTSGLYWIDWTLTGPQSGETYTPPVSILGQPYTSVGGFASKKCPTSGITDPNDDCFGVPGVWRLVQNGTSPNLVDLPFKLNGSDIVNTIFRTGFEPVPGTP